jgi:hypothetical protein
MDVLLDLWHRLGIGMKVLTIAIADEVEAGAAAEVAVLAASCRRIGSSSPMAVDAAVVKSFAGLCWVGEVSATAVHSDRWNAA